MYMNECIKLHNLLKTYGGSSHKKLFKGVKVTKSSEQSRQLTPRNKNGSQERKQNSGDLAQKIEELERANKQLSEEYELKESEAQKLSAKCDDFKGELMSLHQISKDQSAKIESLQE